MYMCYEQWYEIEQCHWTLLWCANCSTLQGYRWSQHQHVESMLATSCIQVLCKSVCLVPDMTAGASTAVARGSQKQLSEEHVVVIGSSLQPTFALRASCCTPGWPCSFSSSCCCSPSSCSCGCGGSISSVGEMWVRHIGHEGLSRAHTFSMHLQSRHRT